MTSKVPRVRVPVKDHDACPSQGLQVVAALHQNAMLGGTADAAEEAEGDGDHQGAGAGHHQEVQRSGDPHAPASLKQQGGDNGQGQGGKNHGGGVVPGEFSDKVFRLGLLFAGILHQVQDLGHGGFPKGPGDPDMEQAGQVDTAADHLVPGGYVPGKGFPGEGGGIQRAVSLGDYAIQGDPLAGLDDDGVSHRHLIRVHLDQLAVPFHIGIVRTDVHQGGDGLPAAPHSHALEELAHLIEEHDGHGLGVLPAAESADGGDGHEKVFVKDLAVADVLHRPPQYIPADNSIGDEVEQETDHPLGGDGVEEQKEDGAD